MSVPALQFGQAAFSLGCRHCYLPSGFCSNITSISALKYRHWATLKSLLGAARRSTASLQLPISAQQGAAWREASDGYRTFKKNPTSLGETPSVSLLPLTHISAHYPALPQRDIGESPFLRDIFS